MGQQQKTGILNLQEKKEVLQVFFEKGMIVGVSCPSKSGEQGVLGKRLIDGGLITAEEWEKACQHKEEGPLGIEKALVSSGLVTRENLTRFLRLLTIDAIYGLFKWKGGTFSLEAVPVSCDSEFVEPLNSEYLLLDVLRMVDESPMIAERLPSLDVVPRKINPEATLEKLQGTPWEKERPSQMAVVYDFIDGRRSVQEIINLSLVQEFETCKSLIILMDAGLIEPMTPVSAKKKHHMGKYLADAGAYLVVGILALFLFFQLAVTRLPNFPWSQEEGRGWSIFQDSLRKVREARIKNTREVFSLEENRYPQQSRQAANRRPLSR